MSFDVMAKYNFKVEACAEERMEAGREKHDYYDPHVDKDWSAHGFEEAADSLNYARMEIKTVLMGRPKLTIEQVERSLTRLDQISKTSRELGALWAEYSEWKRLEM